jgi:hypothetical protein
MLLSAYGPFDTLALRPSASLSVLIIDYRVKVRRVNFWDNPTGLDHRVLFNEGLTVLVKIRSARVLNNIKRFIFVQDFNRRILAVLEFHGQLRPSTQLRLIFA